MKTYAYALSAVVVSIALLLALAFWTGACHQSVYWDGWVNVWCRVPR